MNDSILQTTDTLIQLVDTIPIQKESCNFWLIIAIIFCVVCIGELIYIIHTKKRHLVSKKPIDTLREQVNKDGDVDFENIMNSAFLSSALYDELKVKCHPDRFVNDPTKKELSNDIFQRITQNKVNYKVLVQLKKEAQEKLNI